jgi:hypothetical protein
MRRVIVRLDEYVSRTFLIQTQEPVTFDMAQRLLNRSIMRQWTDKDAFIDAIADFQRLDLFGECLCKLVVDAILHENPVGRHASLPGVAELGQDAGFYCCLDFRIVKDDERTVATQLKRKLRQVVGTLLRQQLADASRAGETQLADRLGFAECLADFSDFVEGCDHVNRAFRKPGLLGQYRLSKSAQWCLAGWLPDGSASSCQCCSYFPGDHLCINCQHYEPFRRGFNIQQQGNSTAPNKQQPQAAA